MRLLNTQPNEDWLTLLTSEGPKRLSLKQIFSGANEYESIQKIDDYLYLCHYGDINYEDAYAHFLSTYASQETQTYIKNEFPDELNNHITLNNNIDSDDELRSQISGACSSVRHGIFFGRNFDWKYDNRATFIIRTPRQHGRFATIGVCSMDGLTEQITSQKEYCVDFKYLPFHCLDGINENGVVCSINIINDPEVRTIYTNTDEDPQIALCQLMLPRYIIDNFGTAEEAVEWLKDHAIIYAPMTQKFNSEIHLLVADKTSSYIVEFIDKNIVVKEVTSEDDPNCSAWMTNFFVNKAEFNEDNTIDVSCLSAEPDLRYAMGVERMNVIANEIENADSHSGMRALCDDLKYTRMYISSPNHANWYTEVVGNYPTTFGDLTAAMAFESDADDTFADIMDAADEQYQVRTREDGNTWQTVHSSVYDITTGTLYIVSQENDVEYEFQLQTTIGEWRGGMY